jgi:hypothetical protein
MMKYIFIWYLYIIIVFWYFSISGRSNLILLDFSKIYKPYSLKRREYIIWRRTFHRNASHLRQRGALVHTFWVAPQMTLEALCCPQIRQLPSTPPLSPPPDPILLHRPLHQQYATRQFKVATLQSSRACNSLELERPSLGWPAWRIAHGVTTTESTLWMSISRCLINNYAWCA